MRPDAAVVCAQNGIPYWYFHNHGGPLEGTTLESVDPGGIIARRSHPSRRSAASSTAPREIVEPGIVRHVEGTRFALCEPDGSRSERCSRDLRGVPGRRPEGAHRCAAAQPDLAEADPQRRVEPGQRAHGATLGELARSPGMVELLRALLEEAAAVGARLGVELPVSLERRLQAAFEVGDHRTSMLMDREAGKPLEHQCMTGAIIELARMLEVPVPRIETVHECISQVDALRTRA